MNWQPLKRPRRLRTAAGIRALIRETEVSVNDLVQPLFVRGMEGGDAEVGSMPGVRRFSPESLAEECCRLWELGIRAVAVFPVIDARWKDATGAHALSEENVLFHALSRVKAECPELVLIADVALDPYTDHGHDGLLSADGKEVLNDETVEMLCRLAVLQAQAGADIVAPSDMMDGRVRAIRLALDEAGYSGTAILSYAAKFASSYYGPFRDAVGSAAAAGTRSLDKRGYQLDPANAREALREALLDEEEGADMLMVKPAGPYLDIVRAVRERTLLPVAAYQVSGEYAQIHAAARLGWLDYTKARDESLLAIKRAGADVILTYFAGEIAAERAGKSK